MEMQYFCCTTPNEPEEKKTARKRCREKKLLFFKRCILNADTFLGTFLSFVHYKANPNSKCYRTCSNLLIAFGFFLLFIPSELHTLKSKDTQSSDGNRSFLFFFFELYVTHTFMTSIVYFRTNSSLVQFKAMHFFFFPPIALSPFHIGSCWWRVFSLSISFSTFPQKESLWI